MSTRGGKLNRYFLVGLVATSGWLAACSTAWDVSSLSGGPQREAAKQIISDIRQFSAMSPACTALGSDLVEAGLKARRAMWFPTSTNLKGEEELAAHHYALGKCPVKALGMMAFAISEHGNTFERERMARRTERW